MGEEKGGTPVREIHKVSVSVFLKLLSSPGFRASSKLQNVSRNRSSVWDRELAKGSKPKMIREEETIGVLGKLENAFGGLHYVDTNTETYHGDGYSFEYPKLFIATPLREDDLPHNRLKYVQYVYGEHYIMVYCISESSSKDPEEILSELLAGYKIALGGSFMKGLRRRVKDKMVHEAVMSFVHSGETRKLNLSVFYVENQERLYVVSYMAEVPSSETVYQGILDSFKTSST